MLNKFLEKYRNFSEPAKASFWFVVSNVMLRGISFITLPLFSRLMTTEQYGEMSVYHSWISIFTIFTTLTLWGGVFNVVMVKNPDKQNRYIAAFQGLAITITAVFLVFSIIFKTVSSSLLSLSPFLAVSVFINILATIPFFLWSAKQRFAYKYKMLVAITVITSVLNPLLGYFFVINTDRKTEARIFAELIINCILGISFFFINLRNGKVFFDKAIWKYAFRFNVVLIPHYLSMQVLSQSDRLMINKICGSSDAGIYSVAYTFGMLLTLVTSGLESSTTPYIYKAIKENTVLKMKKNMDILLVFLMVLSVFAMCLIPDFFKLLLPDYYYSAIWVIPPVIGAVFFMFLYPMFGSVEFYFEERKYVTVATVFSAVVNVILNFLFIKLFGFIAAAYTTLFCYMAMSLFHFLAMNLVLKKHNFNEDIYDNKFIFLLSSVLILIIGIMPVLYMNSTVRWCVIGAICGAGILGRRRVVGFLKEMRRGRR